MTTVVSAPAVDGPGRKLRSEAEWRVLMAEFERWNGTQSSFCKARGESRKSFQSWRRRRDLTAGAAAGTPGGWPAGGIWLSTEPTDMRRSFDGLRALVSAHLGETPASGRWYVFINRRETGS